MFNDISGNFTAIDSEGITVSIPDITTDSLKRRRCIIDSIIYNEDFSDDTDFIYDNTKAEFIGGKVQQKDQTPTDATFGANYDSDINGNWGNGILTGTAIGGALVDSGKLDLSFDDIRYIDYDANLNADSQQTGCIKFKITPNYNIGPSSENGIFVICKNPGDHTNMIFIRHSSGGAFRIHLYDKDQNLIEEKYLGTWAPVLGQEYEMEINWNITIGETRVFIDGIQKGTTATGTGIRDSNINLLRIGSGRDATQNSNFKIDDLIIFSTVQHTANYTPGYSVTKKYVESKIELPEFIHSETDSSSLSATTVESGTPKYIVNNLYWNGSAWVTSDGTYLQANTISEVSTNIGSLPTHTVLNIDIVFTDSASQSSVDNLVMTNSADNEYEITANTQTKIFFENTLTGTGIFIVKFVIRDSLLFFESDLSNTTKIPDALLVKKIDITKNFFKEKIKGQFRHLYNVYSDDTDPLDRIKNLYEIQTIFSYYLLHEIFMDLSIEEGDHNDYKSRTFLKKYRDLMQDSFSLLSVDQDDNLTLSNEEKSVSQNKGTILSR